MKKHDNPVVEWNRVLNKLQSFVKNVPDFHEFGEDRCKITLHADFIRIESLQPEQCAYHSWGVYDTVAYFSKAQFMSGEQNYKDSMKTLESLRAVKLKRCLKRFVK